MYTAAALKSRTVKDLGKLATKFGLTGWRSMRKDELVRALVRAAKRKASTPKAKAPKRRSTTAAKPSAKQAKPKTGRTVRKIQRANEERARRKNLALANGKASKDGASKEVTDRVVLLVRDAYWLQACWELTRGGLDRVKAAMAEQWHTASPVLRLIEMDSGSTTSSAERVVRDIPIHGGVKTWYIDVKESPKSYRVDIGYLASTGRFYSLARSNSVTTPRPGNSEMVDNEWGDIADNCEKIYALSGGYTDETQPGEVKALLEERLGRTMGAPVGSRFGMGAEKVLNRQRDFEFQVDAEMIIYGTTKPNSHVTLAGNPVKLRPDGSFSARLSMPDRRQVLPIVASSADGVEQRTVVLAVERNTKVMEPQIRESHE